MYYSIYATDKPNTLETRRSVRPAHIERLNQLHLQQRLLLAGPYFHQDTNNPAQGGVKGSLIVAQFEDLASAKEWAAADPYVTAGVYENIEVHAFNPVLSERHSD